MKAAQSDGARGMGKPLIRMYAQRMTAAQASAMGDRCKGADFVERDPHGQEGSPPDQPQQEELGPGACRKGFLHLCHMCR